MGLSIESLRLEPDVERAARRLQAAHPEVVFTSGRRSIEQQADAMAANVMAAGRNWIRDSYSPSTASRACQAWIDGHPNARTKPKIRAGLVSVMSRLTVDELTRLSKHMSGRALDCRPGTVTAEALRQAGAVKVLTHESGLARLHAEF